MLHLLQGLARGSGDAEEPTPDVSRHLVIPIGTPIAFSVCELMVREDGSIELVSDTDGGFEMGGGRKASHGLIHGGYGSQGLLVCCCFTP